MLILFFFLIIISKPTGPLGARSACTYKFHHIVIYCLPEIHFYIFKEQLKEQGPCSLRLTEIITSQKQGQNGFKPQEIWWGKEREQTTTALFHQVVAIFFWSLQLPFTDIKCDEHYNQMPVLICSVCIKCYSLIFSKDDFS